MLVPIAVCFSAFLLLCHVSPTFQNWPLAGIKRLKHQEERIKGAMATSAGSLVVPSCWMDLEHSFKCQGGNNPNIRDGSLCAITETSHATEWKGHAPWAHFSLVVWNLGNIAFRGKWIIWLVPRLVYLTEIIIDLWIPGHANSIHKV